MGGVVLFHLTERREGSDHSTTEAFTVLRREGGRASTTRDERNALGGLFPVRITSEEGQINDPRSEVLARA